MFCESVGLNYVYCVPRATKDAFHAGVRLQTFARATSQMKCVTACKIVVWTRVSSLRCRFADDFGDS